MLCLFTSRFPSLNCFTRACFSCLSIHPCDIWWFLKSAYFNFLSQPLQKTIRKSQTSVCLSESFRLIFIWQPELAQCTSCIEHSNSKWGFNSFNLIFFPQFFEQYTRSSLTCFLSSLDWSGGASVRSIEHGQCSKLFFLLFCKQPRQRACSQSFSRTAFFRTPWQWVHKRFSGISATKLWDLFLLLDILKTITEWYKVCWTLISWEPRMLKSKQIHDCSFERNGA